VLFEGASQSDISHFDRMYDYLIRKVSLASGGRQLLLKNPPALGRIEQVLKRYPDTRFIHVYRNPWLVHASTMRLMQRFTEQLAFQDCDQPLIERFVSTRYAAIMDRWQQTRSLIPSGQLVELRHEDITADPVESVRQVYDQLSLSGWDQMQPRVSAYADTLTGYRNNQYRFPQDYLDRLRPYLEPVAAQLKYVEPAADAQRSSASNAVEAGMNS
jgi:hypothetical protein